MFIYNVHTPNKTFALGHRDDESYDGLMTRICKKGGVQDDDVSAVKSRKDGAGLEYEFEGGRWSLEDDGDLAIFQSRFPPATTQSATLHLTPPHPRAHFALEPAVHPTASSALKNKVQSKSKSSTSSRANGDDGPHPAQNTRAQQQAQFIKTTHGNFVPRARDTSGAAITTLTQAPPPPPPSVKPNKPKQNGAPVHLTHTHGPSGGKFLPEVIATGDILPRSKNIATKGTYEAEFDKYERVIGHTADGISFARPKSVISTRSRKSKWGGDEDAEPWWDIHRQRWLDFHANNGVRTVVGKVEGVDNVRMLLKSGYHGVYVSRTFAMKHNLVHDKYSMGSGGYAGIKMLGNISITVGSKTQSHKAMINEEQHFDVVLGRTWIEKMGVKVDNLDQTSLTYMDNGEVIACDLVVLKDPQGGIITVT